MTSHEVPASGRTDDDTDDDTEAARMNGRSARQRSVPERTTARWRVWAVWALLATMASTPAVAASEYGTRDEAVAMVRRVQEMFKKRGADATFQAIMQKAGATIDRDLYAYVVDLKGIVRANGAIAAMPPGTNLYNLKDQDGQYLVRKQLDVCNGPRHGWVDFRFRSTVSQTVEDKSIYVERMGDYCVGVAVYSNEQVPEHTVAIVSGGPDANDTYLRIATDMAARLNDGGRLRILPVVGVGGPQNVRDVRYLKAVDLSLSPLSVLNGMHRTNQALGKADDGIVYIAKLFNEEVHLIGAADVTAITQLEGRKVNFGAFRGGGAYMMRDIFRRFGIKVEEVDLPQGEAVEQLKRGEIAATAYVAGKSAELVANLKFEGGMHFIPIPFAKEIARDYLPTELTHEDYPNLIAAGEAVETVADGVVLIGYDWPQNSERFHHLRTFVETFFSRIAEFQQPPSHPKWREVNIAAKVDGWKRFEPAEAWLASSANPSWQAQAEAAELLANAAPPTAPQSNGSASKPAGRGRRF